MDSDSKHKPAIEIPSRSIPVGQIRTPNKGPIQIVAVKSNSPFKQPVTGSHLVNAMQQKIAVTPIGSQAGSQHVVYYTAAQPGGSGVQPQPQQQPQQGGPQRVILHSASKTILQAKLAGPTITLSSRGQLVGNSPVIALTPSQMQSQTSSGQYVLATQSSQSKPVLHATVSQAWKANWSPPNHQLIAQQIPVEQEPEEPVQPVKGVQSEGNKKPCHCNKSQCLKLYCECFAAGEFCSGCSCQNCANNLDHEDERNKAIKQCLERNPTAFHPKISKFYFICSLNLYLFIFNSEINGW